MPFESICGREIAGDVQVVGCEYDVVGWTRGRVCVESTAPDVEGSDFDC